MIKAVYDTNVIVAALINPDGLPALLLDLATQKRVQLFLSSFLLREYEAVLRRPKFGFSPAKVRNVVRTIRAHATAVKPRENLRVLTDPSDNLPVPNQRYVGVTTNLKLRFRAHNAGASPHTSKYRPWKIVTYLCFQDNRRAVEFERYLKTGSGQAFANKRLW